MSFGIHCDGPGCGDSPSTATWCLSRTDFVKDFWTVTNGRDESVLHFCTADCVLNYFAKFAPSNSREVNLGDLDL